MRAAASPEEASGQNWCAPTSLRPSAGRKEEQPGLHPRPCPTMPFPHGPLGQSARAGLACGGGPGGEELTDKRISVPSFRGCAVKGSKPGAMRAAAGRARGQGWRREPPGLGGAQAVRGGPGPDAGASRAGSHPRRCGSRRRAD